MNDTPEKNPAAVALGKLGKGKKKTLTPAALEARRANAKKAGRPRSENPHPSTLWREKQRQKKNA